MQPTINEVVEVNKLFFDPLNPRLPQRLIGLNDHNKIIDYLLRTGNLTELMKSIAETGYSNAEPLLVIRKDENNYIVVEGNRRLAALKLLEDPSLAKVRISSVMEIVEEAKHTPDRVPVILYEKREDILDYLGYRHITGVKDWGALEKARYLDQLYHLHIEENGRDKIYTVLAKMIGSRAYYVMKLHHALKLYKLANDRAYFGADIDEEDISFSLLTTALGYTSIVDYIELIDETDNVPFSVNEEKFKDIFFWIFHKEKRLIHDSREISDLSEIVKVQDAVEQVKKGASIEEAILFTDSPNVAFINMLNIARQQLKTAKNSIEKLSSIPDGSLDILDDIDKLRKSILGAMQANFEDEQELSEEDISILSKLPPEIISAIKNAMK